MQPLTNKTYWDAEISSGRLATSPAGPLVSAFSTGTAGADRLVLTEVSLRIVGIALAQAEKRFASGPATAPTDIRALLQGLKGQGRAATTEREDVVLGMVAELFKLLNDPGHPWFGTAVTNFDAVVTALIRKSKADLAKSNGKGRVTRWQYAKGHLVKVRPLVQRIIFTGEEELTRHLDARSVEGGTPEGDDLAAELEANERIIERAQTVARDELDRAVVATCLEGHDPDRIAVLLGSNVRVVRYRLRKMTERYARGNEGEPSSLGEPTSGGRPSSRGLSATRRSGKGAVGEGLDGGGRRVPPLEAAE